MSYFDKQDDPWGSSFGSSAPAYSFGEQPAAPQPTFKAPQPTFTATESSFDAPQTNIAAPQPTFVGPKQTQVITIQPNSGSFNPQRVSEDENDGQVEYLDGPPAPASLESILCTHHHADHDGGNIPLKRLYPQLDVFGIDERIHGLTNQLKEQPVQYLKVCGLDVKVLHTPCHTTGHSSGVSAVFVGDTLFNAGCGRLFEGQSSLQ
ncbi:unnamed protein product [Oikopleura dioica]|uniref:Metallo-beta-lactamase domain-containing protein n=1 Tax=Oikopleura dioica TaxID=34765 RepID=E4XQN3_OIKDI|nr:unnamed protein product [Oikopleura dioica]